MSSREGRPGNRLKSVSEKAANLAVFFHRLPLLNLVVYEDNHTE